MYLLVLKVEPNILSRIWILVLQGTAIPEYYERRFML
nr:MAG TPA: hypothetical protein [Caudoviricetes sp.]